MMFRSNTVGLRQRKTTRNSSLALFPRLSITRIFGINEYLYSHLSTPSLANQTRRQTVDLQSETKVFIPTAHTRFSIKSVSFVLDFQLSRKWKKIVVISTCDMSAAVIIPDKHVKYQSSDATITRHVECLPSKWKYSTHRRGTCNFYGDRPDRRLIIQGWGRAIGTRS